MMMMIVLTDGEFMRAIANALADFPEVNQVSPLITLFQVSSVRLPIAFTADSCRFFSCPGFE
jgi:hypothetical protein